LNSFVNFLRSDNEHLLDNTIPIPGVHFFGGSPVVQALVRLVSKDESGVLKRKVTNVLNATTDSIKGDRELLLKHLSGIRRKREQALRKVDDLTSTELVKIAHALEKVLVDCDSEEEKAIAELTGLDAAIQRIEQAEAETDEIIRQANLIEQLWKDKNWEELTRCIDALVEHIDLRVVDDKLVARIHLRALPIIREIMTVRPIEWKAPASGRLSQLFDRAQRAA